MCRAYHFLKKKSKKPRKFPPRLVKSVAGGMLLWRIRRRKANLCPPIRFLCSTETNINLLKSPCDFCTWLLQHHRLAAASTCKVDKGRRCLYRCDSFVPMCSGLHQTGTFFLFGKAMERIRARQGTEGQDAQPIHSRPRQRDLAATTPRHGYPGLRGHGV